MEMDKITAAYVERRGWRVTPDGMIQLTKAQAAAEQYMGRSLRDPKRTGTQRCLSVSLFRIHSVSP